MRTTPATTVLATAALAAIAAGTLGAAPAQAAPASETHRERGVLLECTGSAGGRSAYVSLYENDLFGNVVQVILDDDPDLSGHRTPADIKTGRDVKARVRIDGHRVRIDGTARVKGPKKQVHETHDDAGKHIVIDGTHRRLKSSLTLRYRGTTVPLTCAPAFVYDLQVTTSDIE